MNEDGRTTNRFGRRAVLAAVILINLAILNVLFETRETRLRYAVAKKREAARGMALENRKLLLAVAAARRPDEVLRRAAGQGVQLSEQGGEARVPEVQDPAKPAVPEVRTPVRREVRRGAEEDPNGDHPLLR